ncbi:hypothetical protein P20429_3564 [Pseudoalteromonas sp. BSi20429]|uniref:Uncharacterized protein n=1 Tax=Pseudoalteromonas arctica A 37-1-2 TaxID=1117313 RepID=A0A290SAB8_9GAMM|nr:hypothetical protein PARC_a3631 [Pseudoalteromonas arctica A 37-1-2]GAA69430.1 hypothetical protein P20429_3564 [Pseudoalteromonas sp. BSi20429]
MVFTLSVGVSDFRGSMYVVNKKATHSFLQRCINNTFKFFD